MHCTHFLQRIICCKDPILRIWWRIPVSEEKNQVKSTCLFMYWVPCRISYLSIVSYSYFILIVHYLGQEISIRIFFVLAIYCAFYYLLPVHLQQSQSLSLSRWTECAICYNWKEINSNWVWYQHPNLVTSIYITKRCQTSHCFWVRICNLRHCLLALAFTAWL